MRRGMIFTFVLFAALVGSPRVLADLVITVDGRQLEGEVIDRGTEVVIKTKTGRITVSKDEVARIERRLTPEKELEQKLAGLKPDDAKGHYDLAQWAKERGIPSEVKRVLEKTIRIDPNHEAARKELGYILYEGKWLTDEQFHEAKGYVRFEDRWVKKEERDAILLARKTGALVEQLLKPGCAGDKLLAELKALGAEPLKEGIARLKQAEAEAIAKMKQVGGQEDLEKTLAELGAKREDALKTIFDKKIYPDEDHGRVGQPVVDEKVNAVKAAWDGAKKAFETFLASQGDRSGALERVKELRSLALLGEGLLAGKAAGPVSVADLEGAIPKAVAFETQHWTLAKKVLDSNKTLQTTITEKERENVAAVNEYRFMMGRRPFEISEKLVQAARKHSIEMRDMNYFAHDSPTPGMKTFVDRCKKEGYEKPTGENCHVGSPSGVMAFRGWYHSSGHHRNMLGGSLQIGVGYAPGGGDGKTKPGNYWTQDFGGGTDLK